MIVKNRMKRLPFFIAFAAFVMSVGALDFDSIRFNDYLMAISGPRAPELFEDAVIFTASGAARRVGISFAHEHFSRVHWFRKLASPTADKKESGVLFLAYEFPTTLETLEYRLIVDGLWTTDPWNPIKRMNAADGIGRSMVALPPPVESIEENNNNKGTLTFRFEAVPGEDISVAGTFNDWDPFMYELREVSPGRYRLDLPVPPGTYLYAYYYRGERLLDPFNQRKVYTSDGKTASQVTVQ